MTAELLEPLHQVVPRGLVINHGVKALQKAPLQKITPNKECVCPVDIAANQLVIFPISEFGKRRDRKSTRLNSSHLVISYAVFCLKKKRSTHFSSYLVTRQPHSAQLQ